MNEDAMTYLGKALDYIQEHSIKREQIDWQPLREEVYTLVASAQTTAETYPAIERVLELLGDRHSHFYTPQRRRLVEEGLVKQFGFRFVYPEGIVGIVWAGSPAEQAGIRVGDHIETLNGLPLQTFPYEQYRAMFVLRDAPTHMALTLKLADQGIVRTVQLEAAQYPARRPIQGQRLEQNIGYLDLPGSPDASPSEEGKAYAQTIQQLIREIDQAQTVGWIVDLRRNNGGGCWQMWTGVGPLLDEKEWVAFVSPWEQLTARYLSSRTYYDGSQASLDRLFEAFPLLQRTEKGVVICEVDDSYLLRQKEPLVAVLTSPLTASSGEFAALAFRGLPRSRSFGEPTQGVPTGNESKKLSDGALIALTTSLGVDRAGKPYDSPLVPDQQVKIDWTRLGIPDDPVLQEAVQWLQTEGGGL